MIMVDDDEDTWPGLPALPAPKLPWEEEKKQMAEVIRRQSELLQQLRQQGALKDKVIEQQKRRLHQYMRPVQDLEDEFKKCSEDIRFGDVGGLDPVIDKIRKFEHGMLYPQMYEVYAITPPRGLLLHGPPGCGKTMLAKAVSNEIDCYFLEIPMTRIISKWVGEAEKTLEAILKRCNEVYKEQGKKVLVFVDEAEQMFRKRGLSTHGVIDRCVNVWQMYMDGMAEGEGLIYVAATNKIDLVDDAIKRAGRFDYIIEIPKPDRRGVEEILRKQVAYKERQAGRQIYVIDDYARLADELHAIEVNGADIAEILRITSERQIERFIALPQEQMIPTEDTFIYQHQLEQAIREYRPADRKVVARKIGFGQ